MALFQKKECVLCGGKAGLLTRSAILGGEFICGDCRGKFSAHTANVGNLMLDEVKELIHLKEENDKRYKAEFVTTRRFDFDNRHPMIAVDDEHGWFVLLKEDNPDIFSFDWIAGYYVDLHTKPLSDDEIAEYRRRNGGSGLFGVLNFLLSDDFISRYPDLPRCPRDRKVTGMYFQIDLGINPLNAKYLRLDMLPGWSNNTAEIEKAYYCANEIYQCIKEYKSGFHTSNLSSDSFVPVLQGSAAEQIKEFKELLDIGALVQEEFDAKKKQLLGI